MADEKKVREGSADRVLAVSKVKAAGIIAAGVAASLVLAPDAFARIAMNHSETVVSVD